VWPLEADQVEKQWVPQTPAQLGNMLRELRFHWPVQLVETPGGTPAVELRRLASDTVNGHKNLFGDSNPRRSSPTKFKVVELDGQPRLLVTAPPSVNLNEARKALSGNNKAGRFDWKLI
jgi:hypothetical protein